ncbi:DUF2933 domain-containing protein [Bradyrhizobium sp. USDA 4454]
MLWNHTGHLLSAAPYLLLLVCPLMHLFGHRRGHRHDQHSDQSAQEKNHAEHWP